MIKKVVLLSEVFTELTAMESIKKLMKTRQLSWYSTTKIGRALVWFYEVLCPLRLMFKLERKNWYPANITYQDWYISCGYDQPADKPVSFVK